MAGFVALQASELSITETGGSILVPVIRTGDLTGTVTVTYGITSETATPGADYAGTGGTVVFAENQDRAYIEVPIIDDGIGEATETLVVSLVNVENGFLQAPRTARIDILDDETPATQPTEPLLLPIYDVQQEVLWSGLDLPIDMIFMPTDLTRAYVAEKGGIIKIMDTTTGTQVATLMDLSGVVNNVQDRGLLDIVLNPNFPAEPYLYAFYVVDPPGVTGTGNDGIDGGGNRYAHLMRYTLDAATGYTTVVPGSALQLLGGAGRTASDISGLGAIDSTAPENVGLISSERYVDPADPNPPLVIDGIKQDYIKVDFTLARRWLPGVRT